MTFFFPDVPEDVFFDFLAITDFAATAFLVDGDLPEVVLGLVDLADFDLLAAATGLGDSGLDSVFDSASRRWTYPATVPTVLNPGRAWSGI